MYLTIDSLSYKWEGCDSQANPTMMSNTIVTNNNLNIDKQW